MKNVSNSPTSPIPAETDEVKPSTNTQLRPETFERIIMGTPAQFGNMVKRLMGKFYERGKQDPCLVTDNELNEGFGENTDPVIIWLGRKIGKVGRKQGDGIHNLPVHSGYIVASKLLSRDQRTALTICILAGEPGEEGRHYWKLLSDEISRLDIWFDTSEVAKPGTPTKPVEVTQQAQQNVAKHEPLHCNRWLFREYFDNGRTDLRELKAEWLQIRKEKDFHKDQPLDALKSMHTAIREERKRREKRKKT